MSNTCYRCHNPLSEKNCIFIPGKEVNVCKDCAENAYYNCESCGTYVCNQDRTWVDGQLVCVWCLSEKFICCPHCGSFISEKEAVKFHNHLMCKKCQSEYFEKCEVCGKQVEEDELESVLENDEFLELCPDCLNKKYFHCADCGIRYQRTELFAVQGKNFCRDCFEEMVEDVLHKSPGKIASLLNTAALANAASANAAAVRPGGRDLSFFDDEGYPDDYVGDGLDGTDTYLGDGLDGSDN